jgi:dephospho-CoA kinase
MSIDKKNKIIGLTGMYCAGKNYVARLLEERGFPVLDVDKLGHRAIELQRDLILQRFGPSILNGEGNIARKKLGALVFGNSGELAALEEIVHPAANRLTDEWITAQGGRPCVINAALIHRSSALDRLDAVILVKAPLLTRLIRAKKRDGLPWGELFRRFKSQRNFTSQYLRKNADIYRVYNRGISDPGPHLYRPDLEKQLDRVISLLGMEK